MNIRKKVLSAVLAVVVAAATIMTANAESVLDDDSGATAPIQDQVTADDNEEPESKGALVVVENPGSALNGSNSELWGVIGCGSVHFNIDYSKVAKLSATFTVIEEDREFFDGQCAGGLSLAINNFDFEEGSELWNKYAWTTQTWWGVSDDELGIDKAASEGQDMVSEKIGDYTYKITSNLFENPLANGDFQRVDYMGFAVQEWGVNKARIKVLSLDVMDESDNVLLTYDSVGNGAVQSPSEPEEITYNGIKYAFNGANTLCVIGAEDKDSLIDLVIPKEVDGNTVTELRWGLHDCSNLRSVTFPSTLRKLGSGYPVSICLGCPKLTEFIVDKDNEYFCAEDGILFSKDKTELVRCPSGKTDTEYTVPSVCSYAFYGNKFIEKVTIQGSYSVTNEAFGGCTNLKTVVMLEGVPQLHDVPFSGCTNLATVVIPQSVTMLISDSFSGCHNIKDVYYTGSEEQWKKIETYYEGEQTFEKATFGNAEIHFNYEIPTDAPDDTSSTPEEKTEFTPEPVTDETVDEDTKKVIAEIKVTAPEMAFEAGTVLTVKKDDAASGDKAYALDITFTLNGAPIQPKDGTAVTVQIPVPLIFKNADESLLKVFHFLDGKYTKVEATVENGMVKFDTTHFSTYVISTEDLDENNGASDGDSSDMSSDGEKNPSTGIVAAVPVLFVAAAAIIVCRKKQK